MANASGALKSSVECRKDFSHVEKRGDEVPGSQVQEVILDKNGKLYVAEDVSQSTLPEMSFLNKYI